jgi:hypothetical protein
MDIVEVLKMTHVHSENIAKTVAWLRWELDAAGIQFALIGGLALPYHRYLRFTEDIDILTTKDGLERIHRDLVGRGLTPRFQGARKSLRDTTYNVRVDVITAGERTGSQEVRDGMRLPKLETLISFKIASGIWGRRLKDLGDVQELIKANGLDEALAAKLPAELRPKYLELLEQARGEKTLE